MDIDIKTFNVMISAMFKSRRIKEAKNLLATISAYGLAPSGVTYRLRIAYLINEGLLDEADNLFPEMEKSECPPNSHLLNYIVRLLLEKGEILKAVTYLSKIDEKNSRCKWGGLYRKPAKPARATNPPNPRCKPT